MVKMLCVGMYRVVMLVHVLLILYVYIPYNIYMYLGMYRIEIHICVPYIIYICVLYNIYKYLGM